MSVTYQVNILDRAGQVAIMLDSTAFASLNYTRVLNDVGLCQLTLSVSPDKAGSEDTLTRLLQVDASFLGLTTIKDRLIEVLRFVDGQVQREGTYILRYIRLFDDDDGRRWCILSGFSPEYFLLQRLIDVRNDSAGAGGYSTKSGPADSVMAEYVYEQAGPGAAAAQHVPGLTVRVAEGVGKTVGARQQWEGLLETLQMLAVNGEMDFRLEHVTGVEFEFVAEIIGADLTQRNNYGQGTHFVVFSLVRGNMTRPNIELDWRTQKTDLALLGRGAGDNRELYGAMSGAVNETPYSYAMIAVDARQNEDGDATQYITQAREELSKNRTKKAFNFELVNPSRQYRVFWDLGDRVTAEWDDYFSEDMRITAVEVNVEQEETITPTLEALV
ncbi:hypothetical protein ACFLYO_00415 [Chloroflexota bacterium]